MPNAKCALQLALLLALPGLSAIGAAPTTVNPHTHAAAMQLMEQLGHGQFSTREKATKELIDFGVPAIKALELGCAHPEREVRERSNRILKTIRRVDYTRRFERFAASLSGHEEYGLSGWERFRAFSDDVLKAHHWFVRMHRAEPEAMQSLEEGSSAVTETLELRCQQLRQSISRERGSLDMGSVVAMIFLATSDDVTLARETSSAIYSLCHQMGFRDAMANTQDRDLLANVLSAWVNNASYTDSFQGLYLCMRYDLPEGLTLAEKVLKDPNDRAHTHQYAILTVARLGNESHIPLLESLLNNATRTSQQRVKDVQYETQVRDVALAALVHITKQDHKQFGFSRIQKHVQVVFNTSTVGFSDDAQRSTAIQKWRQYRARQQAKPPAE